MRYALTLAFVLTAGGTGCKKSSEERADRMRETPLQPPQARTTSSTTRSEPRTARRPESPVTPTITDVAKVKWVDAPPALPRGAKVAVLEGAPPFPAGSTFTLLAKMPKNYTIAPHTHLVTEHVTVLKGALSLGHGDKLDRASATKVKAGGGFVMPAGHVHFAFTTDEETTIALTGVGPWEILYVNPKDDPRPTPATRPADFVASTWDAPTDLNVFQAADVAYGEPPPGLLPPGMKWSVLEGDPNKPQTYTIRLLMQKGQAFPVHAHSSTERFMLLAGSVEFAFGDTGAAKDLKRVNLPSVGLVPANQMHYGRALANNTVVQLSGVGPFDMIRGPSK